MRPLNLCNLGTPVKLLCSAYLMVIALGYGMALIQVLMTHGMADGQIGLSLEDIVYSYYGNRSGSLLEGKLNGSMKDRAPEPERIKIIQWIRDGGEEEKFESEIKPIIQNRCVACHNAEAGVLPDFNQFEKIKERTTASHGASIPTLTRVSHIHLFGIAFIFMFVGLIFAFSSVVPAKLKSFIITLPYLSLLLDIGSWWLTKVDAQFALLVVVGGTGMAVAFVFMGVISFYEMWVLPRKLRFPDRREALTRR